MHRDSVWKLLLVEDDADSAEAVISLFGLYGIETLWAIDGPAALQALDSIHRLGERPPDFVLLDVNLPNTNTVELGHDMRSHPIGCPLVLVSASLPQVLNETAGAVGAIAALRKPFCVEEVLALFNRHAAQDCAVTRPSAARR
jgi:CheY-like chemotaxis protein